MPRAKKTTESKVNKKKTTSKKADSADLSIASASLKMPSLSFLNLRKNRKLTIGVGLVLLLLGIFVLGSRYLVIAWVDKKPVSKFDYFQTLDKRYGKDIKEELIVERLITSEAQNRGVSVEQKEIDDEIKKLEEQQGGAEQLNQILEVQGISRDDFQRLVKLQLLRQKMFSNGVNISDEDVNKYIEENKEQISTTALDNPESSEAAKFKSDVKEQLTQQKVNENFNTWLQEALASSRVVRI